MIGFGLIVGVPFVIWQAVLFNWLGAFGVGSGGALATGFMLAIFMANAGGAWDNAKKYIEAGNYGGKGSEAHKASVVGDTVGDPFKDTAGPSLNILLKLMSVTALVLAPIIAVNPGGDEEATASSDANAKETAQLQPGAAETAEGEDKSNG